MQARTTMTRVAAVPGSRLEAASAPAAHLGSMLRPRSRLKAGMVTEPASGMGGLGELRIESGEKDVNGNQTSHSS